MTTLTNTPIVIATATEAHNCRVDILNYINNITANADSEDISETAAIIYLNGVINTLLNNNTNINIFIDNFISTKIPNAITDNAITGKVIRNHIEYYMKCIVNIVNKYGTNDVLLNR